MRIDGLCAVIPKLRLCIASIITTCFNLPEIKCNESLNSESAPQC